MLTVKPTKLSTNFEIPQNKYIQLAPVNLAQNDPWNKLKIFLSPEQQPGSWKQSLQPFPKLLSALHLCLAEHDYKNAIFSVSVFCFKSNLTKLN